MSEKPVYIITFNSANYSMYVYKLLKDKKLSVYMIQLLVYFHQDVHVPLKYLKIN